MSPQFRKVHCPHLLPIKDRFSQHQFCLRCLSAWCLFVLNDLWNAVVCFHCGTQVAYEKGLGTCDTLLCVSHTLKSVLQRGQEARIVQIDISAAFDRVNHQGILYRLCSVGIGGSVLSILTQFLSNRSLHVMVVVGVN